MADPLWWVPTASLLFQRFRSRYRKSFWLRLDAINEPPRCSPYHSDSAPWRLSPPLLSPLAPVVTAGAITELHEPAFGDVSGARQIRMRARNLAPAPSVDPSRYIPGMMRQLKNFNKAANQSQLSSVTPDDLLPALTAQFTNVLPLHHADLSGYGLSSFSQWLLGGEGAGFCKVQFEVLNGRTAYEVVQFRSV